MKIIFILILLSVCNSFSQREEATITRTFGTNSVYPRQFPSSTIRKMNDNEYWIYDTLNTNTIFHRIFPTYIVRRQNTYSTSQSWGVYRTTSTNSVFPNQFPDRYISDLNWNSVSKDNSYNTRTSPSISTPTSSYRKTFSNGDSTQNSSYTYTKSLRSDNKSSYCPENPE